MPSKGTPLEKEKEEDDYVTGPHGAIFQKIELFKLGSHFHTLIT
jgi:hypothetical protein